MEWQAFLSWNVKDVSRWLLKKYQPEMFELFSAEKDNLNNSRMKKNVLERIYPLVCKHFY